MLLFTGTSSTSNVCFLVMVKPMVDLILVPQAFVFVNRSEAFVDFQQTYFFQSKYVVEHIFWLY